MGDTAAFAPETVKVFEFKWLKPGSSVVTLLILLDTIVVQFVVNLESKYVTQFLTNLSSFPRDSTAKIWQDKQYTFSQVFTVCLEIRCWSHLLSNNKVVCTYIQNVKFDSGHSVIVTREV